MKLVAYFSASGITRSVSEKIKEVSGSDIFEIKPIEAYSDEDLNWMDKNSRSSIEMRDKTSRPKMKETLDSIDKYDTIYVGFPVWWYTCPHIVNTFLESFDFTKKTVRVFFTSGGTAEHSIKKSLDAMYSFIKDYKKFDRDVTEEEIKSWL